MKQPWIIKTAQNTERHTGMKTNPVKAALREGKAQIGSWISFGDPFATRIMARMGFPWLTVDMEHGPIDWGLAAVLFASIADAGECCVSV
jgi:4-hydroxy-2-oxoheptanedioate aldolase